MSIKKSQKNRKVTLSTTTSLSELMDFCLKDHRTKESVPVDVEQQDTDQEDNTVYASKELQANVLSEIQAYIKTDNTWSNGLAWELHCYCRVGDDETHHFDDEEINNTVIFIEKLIAFFLLSDNAARFEKAEPYNEGYLTNYLPRLQNLFRRLSGEYCAAQIDEISAGWGSLTQREADNLLFKYQRERRIQSAMNEIIPGRNIRRRR